MATPRFSRAAVVVAFLAGVAGGCRSGGDDDDAREPAPTTVTEATDETTTTAEATTTTLSPEEEVLAAYERASAAFNAAGNPPNAEHPELLATTAGPQLERAQSSIRQLAAQGVGADATYETNPSRPVIVGDRATFTDCGTDRTQLVDLATGAPVGDPGETQLHVDIVMERQGGQWRLVDSTRRTDPCSSP